MPSEIKSATTTAPSSSRRDRRQAPGDGQATADVKQFLLFRVRGLIADRQAFRCIRAQLFQMLLVILHGPPLCPSSTERQLCVNQIVRALIQIKQEFRWGRSLSAGVARWRRGSPFKPGGLRQPKSSRSSKDGREADERKRCA